MDYDVRVKDWDISNTSNNQSKLLDDFVNLDEFVGESGKLEIKIQTNDSGLFRLLVSGDKQSIAEEMTAAVTTTSSSFVDVLGMQLILKKDKKSFEVESLKINKEILRNVKETKEVIKRNQIQLQAFLSKILESEMLTQDSFDKIYNMLVDFGKKKGFLK